MHKRLGFVVSLCGMVFVLLPLAPLLRQPDFVVCTIGFAFVILGIFFALGTGARKG